MDTATTTPEESPSALRAEDAQAPPKRKVRGPGAHLLNSCSSEGRARVDRAFAAWLPAELQAAPGIDWEGISPKTKRYLLLYAAKSPDVLSITLATGCLSTYGGIGVTYLYSAATQLLTLLNRLRRQCGVTALTQLRDVAVWNTLKDSYTTRGRARSFPTGVYQELHHYAALTETHLPFYVRRVLTPERVRDWQAALDRLHPDTPLRWSDLILEPLPPRWLEQTGLRGLIERETQEKRKAQSDVLTPLHPVLVQLALYRHRAMQELIRAYRGELAQVREHDLPLPHHFEHTATLHDVNRAARAVAEVVFTSREVTLSLSIWDRYAWSMAHLERKGKSGQYFVVSRTKAYAPVANSYYLQCHNPPADLFWFGEIIAEGVLRVIKPTSRTRAVAARLGAPTGFQTRCPGLLSPQERDSKWLFHNARREDLLFEPEALYRGVLYGAAIAVCALTSGTRASELLQLSDDRWDQVVVPLMREGRTTGASAEVLLQWVLPKGGKTESERQPKLISPQVQPLLREIIVLLEQQHGGKIPVIQPLRNSKEAHLGPEPYLFQWYTHADGIHGLVDPHDLSKLLRFLLHGVELTTRTGEPIHVGVHLCRHVMATAARHDHDVPPEVIEFLLSHRRPRTTVRSDRLINAATDYYSRLPRETGLAIWHAYQQELAQRCAQVPIHAPSERDLETMDAWMREVFENFGTLGPTALGWCSAGLCVRPNNRALCIGCPFLVEDYRMLGNAVRWRTMFERDIRDLERGGVGVDARQRTRQLEALNGHITIMREQAAYVRGSQPLPLFLEAPRPTAEEDEYDV